LKVIIVQQGVNDSTIQVAKRYDILLPIDLLKKWEEKKREGILKQIDEYSTKMELLKQQLGINLPSENNKS